MNVGEVIAGRYRILRHLGEGGMAAVWAAHHELIGRDVAIKITHQRLASRPEIRDRFLNEAKSVGRVRYPNVIDVIDFGELPDKRLYIVFELLEGESLAQLLEQHGRLSQRDAVAICVEICKGLEVAHANGVIHRDLKPANVYLHRPSGGAATVKLLDFGISKAYDDDGVSLAMTETGMVLGTPQYMSVEQARGLDDIDGRTDIWGVGVILYELISGFIPFAGSNYNAMLDKIIHADPPPLRTADESVSPELERCVRKCLSKSRSERYESAVQLRGELEQCLDRLQHSVASIEVTCSRPPPPMPAGGRALGPARRVVGPRRSLPAPSGAPMTMSDRETTTPNRTPAGDLMRSRPVPGGLPPAISHHPGMLGGAVFSTGNLVDKIPLAGRSPARLLAVMGALLAAVLIIWLVAETSARGARPALSTSSAHLDAGAATSASPRAEGTIASPTLRARGSTTDVTPGILEPPSATAPQAFSAPSAFPEPVATRPVAAPPSGNKSTRATQVTKRPRVTRVDSAGF